MAARSPFVESLPELTAETHAQPPSAAAAAATNYKFFRLDAKIVLCKWNGSKWAVFGEVPSNNLTEQQARDIIRSVEARESTGNQGQSAPPRHVSKEEVIGSFDKIDHFVSEFATKDPTTFAFTESHREQLEGADACSSALLEAARSDPKLVFTHIFEGIAPSSSSENLLATCAAFLNILTQSLENTVKLEKSEYSSDVLIAIGKVRLQFLQMIQAVASTEAATRRLVEIEIAPPATGQDPTSDKSSAPRSLPQAVVNVLLGSSAMFDFVAVQVATNLLKNWTLWPDKAFQDKLIVEYRAVSAVINLFGHKDANVAGRAVATLRHMCTDASGSAIDNLAEDDIAAMEAFAKRDPKLVHPVVRVEFGRLASILITRAAKVSEKLSAEGQDHRKLDSIVEHLSTDACMDSIVFLLAGPHQQLYNEVVAAFKALGWISKTGHVVSDKLSQMSVKINGSPVAVDARLRQLNVLE